ncbi:M23 family metallopeptidase [Sphingomonas sp. LT1P40]|uniref:M23 family metallopeptidase n=1 Tax=Alteristakelama amylovorans TaxID=3096166 RepID=UPI003FA68FCE
MNPVRVTLWTLAGVMVAALVFLAATIRVVDPQRGAAEVTAPLVAEPTVKMAPAVTSPTVSGPVPALIVPVTGIDVRSLRSNWGDARGGGTRAHQGLDIMAPGGTPVVAAADGTVEKLYFSEGGGGISLYERSVDGRWMLYYAHLASYADVREGQRVRAGDLLGYVGDTGNAGAGNYHLHFGMAMMAPGERWHQGTPVDPYPLLAGKRSGS